MKNLGFIIFALLILVASAAAQVSTSQPILDNDLVRVSRLELGQSLKLDGENDVVILNLAKETAEFIPKGTHHDTAANEAAGLVIELKKHWDAEVHTCAYPKQCTHETQMGDPTVAWTTTLFTNGFITANTHKLVRNGTLDSSYYSAKGSGRIVLVPFTDLRVTFDGTDESLKAGQPYFSGATQVEVTAKDAESRWFVLRINQPKA